MAFEHEPRNGVVAIHRLVDDRLEGRVLTAVVFSRIAMRAVDEERRLEVIDMQGAESG